MKKTTAIVCLGLLVAAGSVVAIADDEDALPEGIMRKLGVEFDLRSMTRQLADELLTIPGVVLSADAVPGASVLTAHKVHLKGDNIQVNDALLDYIQTFPGFRSFIHTTESETSIAVSGKNLVATYNTSAGFHLSPAAPPAPPGSLVIDQILLSGFSTSQDGGKSWTSGFFPPVAPGGATLGDPSIDVDRNGNFYFSGLGTDQDGNGAILVNKSTDGGLTWSPAGVVQQDDGSDKEWIAVGPDPVVNSRDNVYVTWTSFQPSGAQLRVGRSVDGGQTFTTRTIFAPGPDPDPAMPQNFLQFSTPVVDKTNGRLYVAFAQFSLVDQDFIRVLVSDDAGESFYFATFNMPGALLPTALTVTQSGELTDCGATIVSPPDQPPFIALNLRLTIHSGAPTPVGQIPGLPFRRFVSATRLVTQPSIAAENGAVYLTWSNATTQVLGDPDNGSNVMFMRSTDAGQTWTSPVVVNPVLAADTQHVLPSLAIGHHVTDVHVLYYTQHTDGLVDVDMATSRDGGDTFPLNRAIRVTGTSFALPPTNVPLPTASQPFATTNYDRLIAPCYALGEYLSVTTGKGNNGYALWGDMRNSVEHPVDALDPLSGQTHSQADVFFQRIKAK